jgi:hypothetical protein
MVANCKNAKRTNGVDKERLGAIERINVAAAIRRPGPPGRLDRSGRLQRHFVEIAFPLVGVQSAFIPKAQEVAVCAHVIEAVIMHADM